MFTAHAAIAFQHYFHPWITKNMDLETISYFASQITENHEIIPKMGPRRFPKSTLKSIKMDIWASVCFLGAPLGPRITKIVPKGPKKVPQGHPNHQFSCKSDPI